MKPASRPSTPPPPAASATTTRRAFLRNLGAGAAAASFLPARRAVARGGASANGRLQFAPIGVGGLQGWNDLSQFIAHDRLQVVALCDVDGRHLSEVAKKFPEARRYRDWREMLDAEGDKLDGVSVTVPDHLHAPISLAAMRAGKHVYCQKPLTHTVTEARAVGRVAADTGVVTQMGNQIHSRIEYRMGTRLVQDGAIGKVREVHSWVGAPGTLWRQGADVGRPDGSSPVPTELDWDLWLGPAPERPYVESAYHTVKWRGFQDFGSGAIGDFGCHIFDPVYTALELTTPLDVTSENPGVNQETWPAWEIIRYTFPGTRFTAGRSIKITWYDAGKRPPKEVADRVEGMDLPGGGSVFIGEEGSMLLPHVGGPQLFPRAKFRTYRRPKFKGMNHYHRWVDACLGGPPTTSNFAYASRLTEAVQLGNIAARFPGETLRWDPKDGAILNHDDAAPFISKPYRKGWEAL